MTNFNDTHKTPASKLMHRANIRSNTISRVSTNLSGPTHNGQGISPRIFVPTIKLKRNKLYDYNEVKQIQEGMIMAERRYQVNGNICKQYKVCLDTITNAFTDQEFIKKVRSLDIEPKGIAISNAIIEIYNENNKLTTKPADVDISTTDLAMVANYATTLNNRSSVCDSHSVNDSSQLFSIVTKVKPIPFEQGIIWKCKHGVDMLIYWHGFPIIQSFKEILDIFNGNDPAKLITHIIPILNQCKLYSCTSAQVYISTMTTAAAQTIQYGAYGNISLMNSAVCKALCSRVGQALNATFNLMVIICATLHEAEDGVMYQGYKVGDIFRGSPIVAGLIPTETNCSVSQLATTGIMEYHEVNDNYQRGVLFVLTNAEASINIISSKTKLKDTMVSYVLLFGYRRDIEQYPRGTDIYKINTIRDNCLKLYEKDIADNMGLSDLYE